MKPISLIKSVRLSFFAHKNTIVKFRIILECMEHLNNNREALTLYKCVNNGTSAQDSDVISGHFLTSLLPVSNSSSKKPADMYSHFYCSIRSLIYPFKLQNYLK